MVEEEVGEVGTYSIKTALGEKASSIDFSGEGTAHYPNGDIYEGNYESGMRQGSGTYTYKLRPENVDCPVVFKGSFHQNSKSGLGHMTYSKNGGFYNGYYVAGKRHGEGTFKYSNGDIYSGQWKDGRKHGEGTYVFHATKYSYRGEWADGQFVCGSWSFTNGTRYVGTFKDQKPYGDGDWELASGTVVQGAYEQLVVPEDNKPTLDGTVPTDTKIYWRTTAFVEPVEN